MFGCVCTDGRVGGGFGCPVIESFTMLAEATAFVIGAAAEFTHLGGGGLIQPERAIHPLRGRWADTAGMGRVADGVDRQFWH